MERIGRAAIILCGLGFVLTINRVPTLWFDSQLYAAIARSRQLYGFGIPSVNLPAAAGIDHIRFYGPVFFDVAAAAFNRFGVSLTSFRLVGLCGAGLVVVSAARLTYDLTRLRERATLAAGLLLLTPEIQAAATSGDLETTAVGFEMASLAIYVRGLQRQSHPLRHGAMAGAFLTLAALTTPRTYPFVAAFLLCALIPAANPVARRSAARQLAAACGVTLAGVLLWAMHAHGGVGSWLNYMRAVLGGDNWNITALPGSTHRWGFNWSSAVTPLAALVIVMIAARRLTSSAAAPAQQAARFAIATTALSGVAIVAGMNLTFSLGMYFALPLFAAGIALPRSFFPLSDRLLRPLVVLLLVCFAGLAALRYTRIAATWSARDPRPIDAFVRQHVPVNADVIGPDAIYFFSIEKMGAHYRSVDGVNADWTRWVPEGSRTSTNVATATPRSDAQRYLIWRTEEALPDRYACARSHAIAQFEPAPNYLQYLGPLGHVLDHGYPATTIYELPANCPTPN